MAVSGCVDDGHLFAPHSTALQLMMVVVRQGYPFFISCRPTHPGVVMTLWKGQSDSPESTQIHPGHDVTYHPHSGFYVRTPNVFYHGHFHCQAQLNATRQFHDFLMFFIRECCSHFCWSLSMRWRYWHTWCRLVSDTQVYCSKLARRIEWLFGTEAAAADAMFKQWRANLYDDLI